MTLQTVTLSDTTTIEVYGGLTACDAYLFASSSPGAAAYRALTADSDDRKRLLVDATRYVDAQDWKGSANALDDTTLAFPRDGLDGYDNAAQLALVAQAAYELVAIAAVNRGALDALDASSNIKHAAAGQQAVDVEFFAPTSIDKGTATKLPVVVQRLLGRFLLGEGTGAPATVGGSSRVSRHSGNFDRCDPLKRTETF